MGSSRHGYILIAVLWSLALIGAVAAAYGLATRTMVSQASADIERAQAHYAARGACIQAVKDLSIGVRRAQISLGATQLARSENIRVDSQSGGVQIGNLPVFPAEMAAAGGFLGAIAQRLEGIQGGQPNQQAQGQRSGGGSGGVGGSGGGDAGVNQPTEERSGDESQPAPLIATGYGTMVLHGVQVEVWLESETGKLNINSSPRVMLESLIAQLGRDPSQARAIVDEIEDYRVSRLAPNDPRRRGKRERLAHEPLEGRQLASIEELSNIASLDGAIRDRLMETMTVYASGAIDPNYAPIEVLRAIGLLDARAIETILDARAARAQVTPESLRQIMGTALYSRASRWFTFNAPPVFTARTRATVGETTARYLIRVAPAGGEAGQAGVTRLLESREDWL